MNPQKTFPFVLLFVLAVGALLAGGPGDTAQAQGPTSGQQDLRQLRGRLTSLRIAEKATEAKIASHKKWLQYWEEQKQQDLELFHTIGGGTLVGLLQTTADLSRDEFRLQDIRSEIRDLEARLGRLQPRP